MGIRVADLLKGVLLFGLLGPPLGSLLYSFLLHGFGMMLSADGVIRLPSPTWTTLGDLASKVASNAFFSYLPGLIPAALTGLLAGSLRRRLSRVGLSAAAAIVGALLALLFMASWQWTITPELTVALAAGLEVMPYGLFAGAVCGWLLGRPRTNVATPPEPQDRPD
jgi:hypothetical protein